MLNSEMLFVGRYFLFLLESESEVRKGENRPPPLAYPFLTSTLTIGSSSRLCY